MVGRLNYSKWDNLELSDDSDIEVHPNIDKKSFIRWKQQDIHQKREQRKHQIQQLKAERETNDQLQPRLEEILKQTQSEGAAYYSRQVSRLSAGREERGNEDGPNGPTIDDMILSLLLQINNEPSVKGKQPSDPALVEGLADQLKYHSQQLAKRQQQINEELAKMEAEDAKKITSDGIREGWSSGHVSKVEPEPEVKPKAKAKPAKSNSKVTSIETLNSPSSSSSAAANAVAGSSSSQQTPDSDAEETDDEEEVPEVSVSMRQFANLPSTIPSSVDLSASTLPSSFNPTKNLDEGAFEVALKFLAAHKELLREESGTTDALLVEAFQAEMRGESAYARRCTEKGLMIQYCNKLGKDGVSLFFRRMTSGDGRASIVYLNDVLQTYARIRDRSKALSESSAGNAGEGEEQIQLVAEDPSTVISFEVPDGPAPEHIELEGEGTEGMDIEKVREFLNRRWKIFCGFPVEMQEALKSKELDKVNAVLGKMKCDEAEELVGLLDQAGILSFSSSEIRDATGRA
ncbi:hsp90 co-chaperone Cdc37 [Thecaphora frezii]